MTRSIQAGHWSTIVLPFTLTKAKAEAAFGARVYLAFEDETTKVIDDFPIYDLQSGANGCYDLSGRKIENIKSVNRKLQKGLYIVNNKKVVVK